MDLIAPLESEEQQTKCNISFTQGYLLNVGDIIKLGRIKLKIREINLQPPERKDNIVESGVDLNTFYNKKTTEFKDDMVPANIKSKKVCRVCYCDENEVDSPLLNPCNCLGGVKYIHFTCLQQWLKSRCVTRSVANENCMMFTVKQMECEICKCILPDVVKIKDKMFEIYEFVKPRFNSWISIETVTSNPGSKTLYIINLDQKDAVKIGRSHDSDLRITDISVSRFHAQINRHSDNTLRIEDNNSKFGSLVLVQTNSVPLVVDPVLSLQVGRSVIFAYVKQPWTFFSCFSCSGATSKEADYTRMNTGHINVEKVLSVKVQNDDIDEESFVVASIRKEEIGEAKDEIDVLSHDNILTSNNEQDDDDEEIDYIDNVNNAFPEELNNLNIIQTNARNFESTNLNNQTRINIDNMEALNSVRVIKENNIPNLKNLNTLIEDNENSYSSNIVLVSNTEENVSNFNKLKLEDGIKMLRINDNNQANTQNDTQNVDPNSNEKKFNTISSPKSPFIEEKRSRNRKSGFHKFEKLDRMERKMNCNDDSVLNINYTSSVRQPKKIKSGLLPMKLNLDDTFKRYEEDSRRRKGDNILVLADNIRDFTEMSSMKEVDFKAAK